MKTDAIKILRFVLYAVLPVYIVFLTIIDLNPSGVRIVSYHLDKPSAMISPLFPAQRLSPITNGSQKVLQQPIYFTVRYPHRYDTAFVQMVVYNPQQAAWRIGLQVAGDSAWSYYLQQPDSDGRVQFDLTSAAVLNRSLRFLIDVAEPLPADFSITAVNIQFRRKPLFSF